MIKKNNLSRFILFDWSHNFAFHYAWQLCCALLTPINLFFISRDDCLVISLERLTELQEESFIEYLQSHVVLQVGAKAVERRLKKFPKTCLEHRALADKLPLSFSV
jgi:hypothetical protein